MRYYTIVDCIAALLRISDAVRGIKPPHQDPEIVDVDYEDITDIEDEDPGEEAYCVPI